MRASDALTVLEQLGSGQWGLVTTAQAAALGVSRADLGRLMGAGSVQRVRHGVYALASAGYGPLQDLQAAWLATDPRTAGETRVMEGDELVVSHVSAAQVHGLGDLIAVAHEFTSPRRRQTAQPDVRFHRLDLPDEDRAVVDALPVTSVERTVADLVASATDFDHLASVVRDALSLPDVRHEELAARLDAGAGHYGFADGHELVSACLESAGLPPVAANLVSSEAFLRSLVEPLSRQLVESIQGTFTRHLLQGGAGAAPTMQNLQKAISLDHLTGPIAELMRQNSALFAPPNSQLTAMALQHLAASSPWTKAVETGIAASRASDDMSERHEREDDVPEDSNHDDGEKEQRTDGED
ncbi:type IV toxin-antitoxin system AbiEi family antitoxin domain-containing protein [Brachybacterium sp. ACRRE]|uniref:type IV toxin-antitoxin system AbiEi family antitoxin domain-containing protein n=1 Tax=Brachybacterium sp. ACRRE TaxID=2918184 RepID=UPI00210801D6|nr:type IV toxin-antitoxin system AbiEi family antitoxin domain-containing protein [Brachybacterium sp. ACRRE]